MTLWHTVIYFVYKLSLNCRFFKAIAGCLPDSSSSRTAHQHTQRAVQETDCGPTVLDFIRKDQWPLNSPNANSVDYHVWCAMLQLTASLKQSQKQSRNSRNRFRLSGATYHKDRSTRLWKTSQIKRLKACVGAWSCRWTPRTYTLTMEFWHLIIS